MDRKFNHDEVKYESRAKNMDHRCGNCRFYIAFGPHCKIVKDPISPNGWCEKHEPKKQG